MWSRSRTHTPVPLPHEAGAAHGYARGWMSDKRSSRKPGFNPAHPYALGARRNGDHLPRTMPEAQHLYMGLPACTPSQIAGSNSRARSLARALAPSTKGPLLSVCSKVLYGLHDFFEVLEFLSRELLELVDELFGGAVVHSDCYRVFRVAAKSTPSRWRRNSCSVSDAMPVPPAREHVFVLHVPSEKHG